MAVSKTDKTPVFRGLLFPGKKVVIKTRHLGGKIDVITLLRKVTQRREGSRI